MDKHGSRRHSTDTLRPIVLNALIPVVDCYLPILARALGHSHSCLAAKRLTPYIRNCSRQVRPSRLLAKGYTRRGSLPIPLCRTWNRNAIFDSSALTLTKKPTSSMESKLGRHTKWRTNAYHYKRSLRSPR